MKKELLYIAPVRAGVILAVLYGIMGLLVSPFFLLMSMFGSRAEGMAVLGGLAGAILIPLLYAVAGFIGGVLAAAIYNLIVRWTGGFQFEFKDVPPGA